MGGGASSEATSKRFVLCVSVIQLYDRGTQCLVFVLGMCFVLFCFPSEVVTTANSSSLYNQT